MTDLIYDNEMRPLFEKRFPKAKITDASDCFHRDRFMIETDEIKDKKEREDFLYKEYFKFLILNGCAGVSLAFGLSAHNKEGMKKIRKMINEEPELSELKKRLDESEKK